MDRCRCGIKVSTTSEEQLRRLGERSRYVKVQFKETASVGLYSGQGYGGPGSERAALSLPR